MKLMIIIGSSGLGGAERVSFNLAKWFSNQPGCQSSILSLSPAKYEVYTKDGYDYTELRSKVDLKGIRRVVKDRKPDIVLTMGVPICIYSVIALFGLNVKHVISERNDPEHFAGKTIVRVLSRALMKFADGYVFQTKSAQQYYGKKIMAKSEVIHNPLSFDLDSLQYAKTKQRKEIITAGRLNEQKNYPMLLRAFSKFHEHYPDYTLTILGEGPERYNLERLACQLNIERYVCMPGKSSNVFERIKDSAMFVLCSDFEGMPNALMEALAIGLPSISTNCPCGGPAELIINGLNGLLIPVGDEDELVTSMLYILNNPVHAERMGKEASKINQTHSIDIICQKWYSFFQKLI